jgi:hypothetical protein
LGYSWEGFVLEHSPVQQQPAPQTQAQIDRGKELANSFPLEGLAELRSQPN